MTRQIIINSLKSATGQKDIHLEIPENSEHGEYSTNMAMTLRVEPLKVVEKLRKDKKLLEVVAKVEVAGPGFLNGVLKGPTFINFYLRDKILVSNLTNRADPRQLLKGKKYLLEHTSPNTIKTLHVGHVRNNVLGMAVHNLLESVGAKVTLDAINNDRGIHVMKAVWAYMKYGKNKTPKDENTKPDTFVDKFYVMGAKAASDKEKKQQMQKLLQKWEAGDKEVHKIWKKLRDWTLEGFKETYKRLGSHHDKQWFESDFYKEGKEIVKEGLKKDIFKKLASGAVLSNLKKYNLPDTIVLRADGTSMYHTQDLYLTKLKRENFPSDKYYWDVGPEQTLYLKQLYAMLEQLGIGTREDYMHLSYGFVYLTDGKKMSSRAGNVVSADTLINKVVEKAKKINKKTAEQVGVGAIKYGILKPSRERDAHFDIEKSLSLEGNSGPYLQYTYARAKSVLRKAKKTRVGPLFKNLNAKEKVVIRKLLYYPEIVEKAAITYSPNLVCNYLYELARDFNAFYNAHRILDNKHSGNDETSDTPGVRLLLTKATSATLKDGLTLLGISTPERM